MDHSLLPSFERPPVVETVLGVQFEEIPDLTNAQIGAFWSQLGDKWPNVCDAPKLEHVFETFGEERAWSRIGPRLKFTQDAGARLQIRNASEDRMIQVQNGRFHYNWLGQTGGEYPRYREVRPEFDQAWTGFTGYLRSIGLPEPNTNQWEVTYINHIPKGPLWDTPADWSKVLSGLLITPTVCDLTAFESLAGQWHFDIVPQRGRLHLQLLHGRPGSSDDEEILRLDLTARGPVGDEPDALGKGLDLGRKAIVSTFKAITSSAAHQNWGIHNG